MRWLLVGSGGAARARMARCDDGKKSDSDENGERAKGRKASHKDSPFARKVYNNSG